MDEVLLVRFHWVGDAAPLGLIELARRAAVPLFRALEGDDGCAYLEGADAGYVVDAPALRTIRLQRTCRLPGAAFGAAAPFHYVVATDVAAGGDAELNAWYDEEHLPGLAAVPGVARAARYLDPAGSPRYHACYDLATLSAFNSPAWLAVRGTAWSARVRPTFRATRRTMYRRIDP
jgi:hypothetical protein